MKKLPCFLLLFFLHLSCQAKQNSDDYLSSGDSAKKTRQFRNWLIKHFHSGDYYYNEFLMQDIKLSTNLFTMARGFNPELVLNYRPSRFFQLCLHAGKTFNPGDDNNIKNNPSIPGYNVNGDFFKAGIKNYLLNGFFDSRYDIFTGLYYIGSEVHESNSNLNKSIFSKAMALQSGINLKINDRWIVDIGVQCTFLKGRKNNSAPSESYVPGMGQYSGGNMYQGILTIQYKVPLNWTICNICHYWYNECNGYPSHRGTRAL